MNQPEQVIRHNLRRFREARNLSYVELASVTGVSKSMLRQIEIGESSPTINTLWRIANGLEIPFSLLLLAPGADLDKRHFKDASPLHGQTDGYRLYPMVTFDTNRTFEVYYVEVDAGVALDADPHTGNAEEIVMVLQGQLEIRVQDVRSVVAAQEMLRFQANQAHGYQNPGPQMAAAIMIISYAV